MEHVAITYRSQKRRAPCTPSFVDFDDSQGCKHVDHAYNTFKDFR